MQNDPENPVSPVPESAPEPFGEADRQKAERREQLRLKRLSERELLGKGVIYSAHSRKVTALLTVFLALIAFYLLYFAVMLVISFIRSTIGAPEYIFYDILSSAAVVVVFMLLPAIAEIVLFRYIIRGYACDYTANRVEFCITRKGRTVMNILYKDAVSVEYRPMKYLWYEQGFHVTVKMKSYSLCFDYVVPRAMRFHTENFPFEIILREVVRREIGEENAE